MFKFIENYQKYRLRKLLIKAKALIDTPEKWTIHVPGRDVDGKPLHIDYLKTAVQYCSVGAIAKTTKGKNGNYFKASSFLQKFTDGKPITTFNDRNSHEEVMKVWDAAIKSLEK